MRQIIRSAQFEHDLIAVWRYIAEDSPDAATRLLERIDGRVALFSEFPYVGESQPQFGANTRRIIEGAYLIFYDVQPDAVHILRAFHSARKLDGLFD